MLLTTLALVTLSERATASTTPTPLDVSACATPSSARYSFAPTGDAQFAWGADPTLCLAASAGTAAVLAPCAGDDAAEKTAWSRVAVGGGFWLSPARNASLCLRAQPTYGAALLLPCTADPWNSGLHVSEGSHPHAHAQQAVATANPCCSKTKVCRISAACSSKVCAACPKIAGDCPQTRGTVWTIAGRALKANMSTPFRTPMPAAPTPQSVSCTFYSGCLGAATAPTAAQGVAPLAWLPVPLSAPLRPTPGGWMHAQLIAQRYGFGGHEYPMSDLSNKPALGPKVATVYRRIPHAACEFLT